MDAGSEVAGCLGNVFNPGETHDTHGKFTQGRHHVGSVLGADLGEVFALPPVLDIDKQNKRPASRGALPSGHPEWPHSAGYARHRAKAAIMMRLHQGVPAFPLRGQGRSHLNAVQISLLVLSEFRSVRAVKTTASTPESP